MSTDANFCLNLHKKFSFFVTMFVEMAYQVFYNKKVIEI